MILSTKKVYAFQKMKKISEFFFFFNWIIDFKSYLNNIFTTRIKLYFPEISRFYMRYVKL